MVPLHDEGEDITAGAAAKAVKKALFWIHGKRRRFFRVERAASPETAAFFLEVHRFGNNAHNISGLTDLFLEALIFFLEISHTVTAFPKKVPCLS